MTEQESGPRTQQSKQSQLPFILLRCVRGPDVLCA
jgi:hypothetical protein